MTMQAALPPDCSFAEVMRHVDRMRTEFPNRKSGQGLDLAAARYVVETLSGYGLEASLQSFETYDSDIGTSFVALDGPGGMVLESLPCLHVEATPPDGVTAELVDVGPCGLADYDGKDVTGKIVLAEVSYAPATPEKARIAAAKGAAGIILMNWGGDDSRYIPWRALKAVWGNPTPESWEQIPRLFGVSISRADGIMLRSRMMAGPVRLHVKLEARRVWRELSQPIAWLHAPQSSPERDQFVVVSGHIDSWNPGVTDNITGMSVMMEIARSLAASRESLRRSLVFCFWNGHEVAEAAGSTYFVDSHWEQLNRNGVAYVNIDSVGMRGTSEFHVNSCPELAGFAERLSAEVFGQTLPQKVTTLRRVGDQSFFGLGLAAMTGRHSYGGDVVKAHNGATLGWYNHTDFDTVEVMDPDALEGDLTWCLRGIRAFATAPVLPQRFTPRLADMAGRFAEMLAEGAVPAALERIPGLLAELRPQIEWFDGHLAACEAAPEAQRLAANRLALRLSRLLTFVTSSASGRYGQDSYGVSTLALPVPMLADLQEWRAAPADSLEAKLLLTRLMRLRQRITDTLETARLELECLRRFVAANGKS